MQSLTKALQGYRWFLFPADAKHRLFIHVLFWVGFLLYHLLFFLQSYIQQPSSVKGIWVYAIY